MKLKSKLLIELEDTTRTRQIIVFPSFSLGMKFGQVDLAKDVSWNNEIQTSRNPYQRRFSHASISRVGNKGGREREGGGGQSRRGKSRDKSDCGGFRRAEKKMSKDKRKKKDEEKKERRKKQLERMKKDIQGDREISYRDVAKLG